MSTALKLVHSTIETSGKRDYINRMAQNEPKTGVLFKDFIQDTVAKKARRMGNSYQVNYNTLLVHLEQFSQMHDAEIYTNSVSEDFLDDFILYLQDLDLKHSYIKCLVSQIKAMATKAAGYGYAIDPSYNDVELDDADFFSVFLSMNEITRIYYFRGLTRKQEQVRDLFVLGCLTALRYSDYSTLTRDNFQGDYIVKVTKKTGKKVTIPIHDYIREIFKRYDGVVSKGLSIQYFNKKIKSICQKIGLNDQISFSYTKGGKLIQETKQKWEMISSHTARRSAATNMYLTGRMKTYEIMAITAHTTEKSFFRYIKVTGEDTAKQISADTFFRK
jgi:integrase